MARICRTLLHFIIFRCTETVNLAACASKGEFKGALIRPNYVNKVAMRTVYTSLIAQLEKFITVGFIMAEHIRRNLFSFFEIVLRLKELGIISWIPGAR